MHDVAETGVAAHWSYRDGVRSRNPFAVDPAKWIAQLTEQFDGVDDHENFLEAVKLEMYTDKVFCFTPKGEVIKLPRGATPIDFAYAIHTRIGSACVGAKIDGIRVPLWTRIKNGQSVEIITAEGQTPQVTWLDIATTGKAKTAIRRSLREVDRARFAKLGRELARSAFEHVGKKATDKVLATAARALRVGSVDDLLEQLGSAEKTGREVVSAVYPKLGKVTGEEVERKRAVIGLEPGQSFDRAPCCEPLPGERIVGITFRGKGVTLHAIDCDRLSAYEEQAERWLDLRWHDGSHPAVYSATIDLTLSNDPGVLGRICTLIGEAGANIADLNFVERKPDFFRVLVSVEVRDAAQLHSLMLTLEAEDHVAAINRYRDTGALADAISAVERAL